MEGPRPGIKSYTIAAAMPDPLPMVLGWGSNPFRLRDKTDPLPAAPQWRFLLYTFLNAL